MLAATPYQIFCETLERYPQHEAVIDYTGTYSYLDLEHRINKLAQQLKLQGIIKNSLVSFSASEGCAFLVVLLALSKLGAVSMPFDASTPQSFRKKLEQRLAVNFSLQFKDFSTENFIVQQISSLLSKASLIDQPVAVRPSSGTTGQSKGVLIAAEGVAARVHFAQKVYQLQAGERVGFFLPMPYHFVVSILAFVKAAACIVAVPRTIWGRDLHEYLKKLAISFTYAAPISYASLAGRDLSFIRTAISTTSAIGNKLAQDINSSGVKLCNAYGIIELGIPFINLNPNSENIQSIGKIAPGYEARLSEEGELQIKSKGIFAAYLDPYKRFSELHPDTWFATGDLARFDEAGNCFLSGRQKNVIITAGHKVFPEEVEAVILEHPAIYEARVFAEHDDILGNIVCADVVTKSTITQQEIRKWCRERLEAYKIPHQLSFCSKIAKTFTGKVRRC